jgi:hypothetical protein
VNILVRVLDRIRSDKKTEQSYKNLEFSALSKQETRVE